MYCVVETILISYTLYHTLTMFITASTSSSHLFSAKKHSSKYIMKHATLKPKLPRSQRPSLTLDMSFLYTDDIKFITCIHGNESQQNTSCLCVHYVDNTVEHVCMSNEDDINQVYNLILDTLKRTNRYVE